MKYFLLLLVVTVLFVSASIAQTPAIDSTAKAAKDSLRHAKLVRDSIRMETLFAIAQYPWLKGSKWSGVIPVENPTEVPNPNKDYKLLFELTQKNPDSLKSEINAGLDEVARILNLHFASGISPKRIIPVIVMHGPGLIALSTNETHKKKYSIDNPNLKLIDDLKAAGVKFIACGQAMAFFDFKKEDLLPVVRISLTAQTVLSNYQSDGYTLYTIKEDK